MLVEGVGDSGSHKRTTKVAVHAGLTVSLSSPWYTKPPVCDTPVCEDFARCAFPWGAVRRWRVPGGTAYGRIK
eukprot:scaffold117543_cov80-Phaeocystis_antarctica.AAC.6